MRARLCKPAPGMVAVVNRVQWFAWADSPLTVRRSCRNSKFGNYALARDADDAAMEKMADDDAVALDELIGRWKNKTAAFLYRFTGNAATAAELTAETFVRVYQQRAKYRPRGRFSSWLFQIAANLARHHLRWQTRHPETSFDGMRERDCPLSESTPAADLDQKERVEAVRRAILQLPCDQREALILQEYEYLSMREIASIQKTSEKAVENRLYRARQALRKDLSRWLDS